MLLQSVWQVPAKQYGAAHITALNASIRHRPYKPAQACAYQGLNEGVNDYKYVLRAAPSAVPHEGCEVSAAGQETHS